MAWSGGSYTRTNGVNSGATTWVDDRDGGTGITSALHDTHDQDLADGLELCIARDGQNTPSADLPMNSQRFTDVGGGQLAQDYTAAGQFQSFAPRHGGTSTGASGTFVISLSPALPSLASGTLLSFISHQNSAGSDTLNVNGLGAKTIDKMSSGTITSSDISSGKVVFVCYNATGGGTWQLLNPQL